MNDIVRFLISAEDLPEGYIHVVQQYWAPLAGFIARRKQQDRPLPDRPLIVGVNGAQGSGKSTMCQFLVALLEQRGLTAIALSVDDFYLTHAERQKLAGTIHPLFATRGVPGTHDTALMRAVLDGLTAGRAVEAPRFDKATDDRSPVSRWIEAPVDVILLEGWCIGASPQTDEKLHEPVNSLEQDEDPEGIWRAAVNRHLTADYAGIFARLDLLIMLAVPNFEAVAANRRLQEEKLARRNPDGPAVMDEAALARFMMHYERLTRHMLAELPARADVIIPVGIDQCPTSMPDLSHG